LECTSNNDNDNSIKFVIITTQLRIFVMVKVESDFRSDELEPVIAVITHSGDLQKGEKLERGRKCDED